MSDDLGTMAMVNYPYATNFVNQLPAWPMTEACYAANNVTAPTYTDVSTYNVTNLMAIQRAANVFSNYTGDVPCLNITAEQSGGLDTSGWTV